MSFDVKWSLAFVAAAAVGVVACTITSGTVDDTGLRTSGPALDSGSPSTDTDSAITTCEGNRQGLSTDAGVKTSLGNSVGCQECMETNCCTALTTCFNKVAPTADDGTCDDYTACVESCITGNSSDPKTCRAGCDTVYPTFTNEYAGIVSCRNTSCSNSCPLLDLAP